MELNLKEKITFISGLNGSGKTWFAQHGIIPNYKCLVHDPLKQYGESECFNYVPPHNTYPAITRDNDTFVKAIMDGKSFVFRESIVDSRTGREEFKTVEINPGEFDLLIFEEASRTFPNGKPFFSKMRSFLDTYRHYNDLGLVFICRRASQIQTDIPSLAHHLICFGNKGVADISRLNQESKGLGDAVAELANFDYVFVDQDRNYQRMPKI